MGLPPTARRVTITGIPTTHLAEGKIVEHWLHFDALGMLEQLSAIPTQG